MPKSNALKTGDKYARVKWQHYVFWMFFIVWVVLVFVGVAAALNLPFKTTYVLPLVEKDDYNEDHYVGAIYSQKYTFLWSTALIVPVFRFALAFASFSYLNSHRQKRLNLAVFSVFFLLYVVAEGCNLIAHGLEWKDANKQPDQLADTNYDRNIANSWTYCCEFGNFTPYCENYRAGNASIPCYGWVSGTELTPNPDFLTSVAIAIGCFACACVMAILGYSGREELLMVFRTQSGEDVLVRMN